MQGRRGRGASPISGISTSDPQPGVLVTGASGFVGGEIAFELQRAGYRVTALVRPGSDRSHLTGWGIDMVEGNITNPDAVAKAMDGQTFACHAAALVPGTGARDDDFEIVNVDGTRTVCEAAERAGISRLVHVSTAHVFGIQPGTRVDEESTPASAPHAGYDTSKAKAEAIVLEYVTRSLDAVVVNPAVVLGPRSKQSGRLISLFLRGMLPVIPLPDRVLSMVYSVDVAHGVRLALECGNRGERYLLASPEITVREFIQQLANASGRRAPRLSAPGWLVAAGLSAAWSVSPITRWRPPVTVAGVRHGGTIYDGRKAVRELGMSYTPIDVSLSSTVTWLESQRRR